MKQVGAGLEWHGIYQPQGGIPEERLAQEIPDVDNSEWHTHDKRWVRKTKGVLSKSNAHGQRREG